MILQWQRYFLRELFKVFLLFITSFYFLYILIDYSAHAKIFHQDGLTFFHAALYYLCQFTNRCDILLPIALLIATIKVLTTSSLKKEIVALVTGGIPIRRLLFPFLAAAFACMCFLYANFQYIQPQALTYISSFEDSFFKDIGHNQKVHHILLQDSSLLLYQSFDSQNNAFVDACWLPDQDTIYRMNTLYPETETPKGNYVDLITRQEEGGLILEQTFDTLHFPKMRFENKALFVAANPPRRQSLSQLFRNLSWRAQLHGMKKMSDREAEISAVLFHKLTLPFISLLAVLAPASFCLKFGRHLPLFIIYALSVFGLIGFFMVTTTALILGESQVLPPLWAILSPPLIALTFFGRKYAKL